MSSLMPTSYNKIKYTLNSNLEKDRDIFRQSETNHVDQHHCTVSDLFVFFILITDSVCIDVKTTLNSSCYFTSNGTNGTRDEAKDFCEQRGAHLVFIETAEENSFLFNSTRGKYCIIFLCIKLK